MGTDLCQASAGALPTSFPVILTTLRNKNYVPFAINSKAQTNQAALRVPQRVRAELGFDPASLWSHNLLQQKAFISFLLQPHATWVLLQTHEAFHESLPSAPSAWNALPPCPFDNFHSQGYVFLRHCLTHMYTRTCARAHTQQQEYALCHTLGTLCLSNQYMNASVIPVFYSALTQVRSPMGLPLLPPQ